jgi:hypothetical protein
MGRWDDGKGGLAHREGIREEHWIGEVRAARSAADLFSVVPRIGRRVGAGPISFGARFGADDRALPRLQAVVGVEKVRDRKIFLAAIIVAAEFVLLTSAKW